MKKIAVILAAVFLAGPVLLAQEEDLSPTEKQQRRPGDVQTVFNPNTGSGGYGAFSIGYTKINGRDALLMGGRGEWVVGHGFGLGLGGYGFVNDPVYNAIEDLNYSLAGGYGGLMLEPILFGWFPVHLAFPILIGAGGVSSFSYVTDWADPYEYYPANFEDASAFFVAEAGVEVEFNLVRFFRLAIFGTYRYTTDIVMPNVEPDALRGWNVGMTFKFGSF
jgi:hypothetical protein